MEQLLVDREGDVDAPLVVELLRRLLPAGLGHEPAPRRIVRDFGDRRGERGRVVHRYEQTGPAVVDDLPAAPDVGRDDREAHRGRLHRGTREAFAVGRERVQVERRVARLHVVPGTDEMHVVLPTGGLDLGRGQRVALLLVLRADDDEVHVGCGRAQEASGGEDLAVALLVHEPADHTADDGVGGHAPLAAQLGARGVAHRGRVEAVQVDPVAEQVQLLPAHTDAPEHVHVLDVLDQLGM